MQLYRFLFALFLGALIAPVLAAQSSSSSNADPVLLQTMQQELARAMSSLAKADPATYFISHGVDEEYGKIIVASNGAIVANMSRHERNADISVRVGSRDLDNTHGENRYNAVATTSLPLDDRADAIARVLWLNTDRMYKKASQAYLEVKTKTKVHAEEEDSSPDFSTEKPEVSIG